MTTHDATTGTSGTRTRRRLGTVLLAAVACSVCLLPALATTAALTTITGWLTGTTGLTITAGVATVAAGLLWARRGGPGHQSSCGCDGCH